MGSNLQQKPRPDNPKVAFLSKSEEKYLGLRSDGALQKHEDDCSIGAKRLFKAQRALQDVLHARD